MRWIEVSIETTSEGADAMAEVLFGFGVSGVSIEDPNDIELYKRKSDEWDYLDESIFCDQNGVTFVKGYLTPENAGFVDLIRSEAKRVATLPDLMVSFGTGNVSTREVMDEDWAENWKQYYHPFIVGRNLAVTPCWEDFEAPGRIVVRMEPGAAFGSGQHETTLMCLTLLDKVISDGDSVLDIGCGTGILGICAVCMGASEALLIDRDEIAVSAARHNAALNRVEDLVIVKKGDLADCVDGQYDIVFANIVADAVIALLPDMHRLLTENGCLIASGIIADREDDVIRAANAQGLSVDTHLRQGEWIALLLVRS